MLCADCLVIWIFLESSLLKTEVIASTSTKQIHIFFKIYREKIQATNVLSNYGHFSASVNQILFLPYHCANNPTKLITNLRPGMHNPVPNFFVMLPS